MAIDNKVQLKFREVNRDIFEAILRGEKKVETRAASPKFLNLKTGDILRMVCGKDYFEKIAKKVTIFKTIEDLLDIYKVEDINPSMKSAEELRKMYYSFPEYEEKIKKYGIIAIEL
jgi:ASC-1-like (ASCH) protein